MSTKKSLYNSYNLIANALVPTLSASTPNELLAETDTTRRKDTMEKLLYAWTGVSEANPVRGYFQGYGNGRQIAVLEELFADSYKNGQGSSGPQAQPFLEQSWNIVFDLHYSQLMAQTHLKDLYSQITYSWDTEGQTIKGDLTNVIADIQNLLATDQTAGKALFTEFTNSIATLKLTGMVNWSDYKAAFINSGTAFSNVFEVIGKNNIFGLIQNDGINATNGDDAIWGYSGNDSILGGAGNPYKVDQLECTQFAAADGYDDEIKRSMV